MHEAQAEKSEANSELFIVTITELFSVSCTVILKAFVTLMGH
jgi:hypothetical protein